MPNDLEKPESELSMSAETLQHLVETSATDKNELRQLLGIHGSTVYDYLGHRELRFDQLVRLFKYAKDDKVREAFLAELITGTSYIAHRINPTLDIDGDGDVDEDDQVKGLADLMSRAAESLRRIHSDHDRKQAVRLLTEVISIAAAVRNIEERLSRRKPARQNLIGGGA